MNRLDQLCAHVADTRWERIPSTAINAAKTFITDSIGVAIGGSQVPDLAKVKQAVFGWGKADEARVWVSGERLPASSAAIINGLQIHNQEWDCVHEPAVVHPMAVILSVLLAHAERSSRNGSAIDGRALIAAVIVAVDVAATLGISSRAPLRFFRPAWCGALGATLALGRLAGFDRASLRSVFGIAYSQLSGTMQAHVEGSPMLALQIGMNARAALAAFDLARVDFSGPVNALEGPFGYFQLVEGDFDASSFDQLGQVWRITEVSHKPFPTGRAAHGTLDMLGELQRTAVWTAKDVSAVRIFAPPLIRRLVGRAATAQMTPSYARLCLPFLVASLLLEGSIGPDTCTPAALADPSRLAFAERVSLHPNECEDVNALVPQSCEIELHDGRIIRAHRDAVLGSPARPLSTQQQHDKFAAACATAIKPFPADRQAALRDCVQRLEELPDVTRLVDLMIA